LAKLQRFTEGLMDKIGLTFCWEILTQSNKVYFYDIENEVREDAKSD